MNKAPVAEAVGGSQHFFDILSLMFGIPLSKGEGYCRPESVYENS